MQDHRGDKREGNDNGGRYSKRVRLFLFGVGAVRIVAELVFHDLVVVGSFQVAKFRTVLPAGIGVAAAMRAERGVVFQFGVAVWAVHN